VIWWCGQSGGDESESEAIRSAQSDCALDRSINPTAPKVPSFSIPHQILLAAIPSDLGPLLFVPSKAKVRRIFFTWI
jgi:hypothetical protein